jgi:uncharacterized phage-associated protein
MPHDVRAIANFVLDLADRSGHSLTNMALNKLVYFAYEEYLLKTEKKLTNAKIEAWDHGPVFRELYNSFKIAGDARIRFRAEKINPVDGVKSVCELSADDELLQSLQSSVGKLISYSASRLRNLSHLPGSPWDKVWNHSGHANAGMQITDEIIRQCFKSGRQ